MTDSAAPSSGETRYVDPVRRALVELLREGIEWVERPVADQDDAALCLSWIQRAKEAVDGASA